MHPYSPGCYSRLQSRLKGPGWSAVAGVREHRVWVEPSWEGSRLRFVVGRGWRTVGQGRAPITCRVCPCTAFCKPSCEKGKGGKARSGTPRVGSRGQSEGGRRAEDSPRAVDDLLVELLTQRCLLLYSSWSRSCVRDVKSTFPSPSAEAEQVLESPLRGRNTQAQHRDSAEIRWENDVKLGHPLLFLKLGFILLVCSSGRM